MRELTRREVVAMWLWSAEYAKVGIGAIEWYERLSPSRKRNVEDLIKQYEKARALELGSASVAPSDTANAE